VIPLPPLTTQRGQEKTRRGQKVQRGQLGGTAERGGTEDGAKKDFSFLFGKSVVLVPRPHQNQLNQLD